MMSTNSKETIQMKKRILPTSSAPTLNKVSAKKAKNVSTLMIWPSIVLNKLIFTSIKGLSWSWMQLEANNLVIYPNSNWTRWSARKKDKSSRDVDLILFASSSLRLLKKTNMDGIGHVQTMVINANTNIAYLLATSSKEMEEGSRLNNKSTLRKKLMRKEINFLHKISQVTLLWFRSSGDLWGVFAMERRPKKAKVGR